MAAPERLRGVRERRMIVCEVKGLEATSGFEPEMKALQASALPLGHVAPMRHLAYSQKEPTRLL